MSIIQKIRHGQKKSSHNRCCNEAILPPIYLFFYQQANQTAEASQGNASDGGSNISEEKKMGKNITEVEKKLVDTISKKQQDLAR